MYTHFYHLKSKPFQICSDPSFIWLGEKHKEALATLKYGVLDNKGFLLLTGDVGTGKTTLINTLIASLGDDVIYASVPDPRLEKMDFFNYIAGAFGFEGTFQTKGQFLAGFSKFLHQAHGVKKKILLIIDESQLLTQDLLEEIRLLSNIGIADSHLLNIFFVGQNEFNEILSQPENRAVAQRLTLNYHLDRLSLAETEKYIRHRLDIAGTSKKLFENSAIREIYFYSGGFPRRINIICDHCLLTGYVNEKRLIDAAIVKDCAKDLKIPQYKTMPLPVAEGPDPESERPAAPASKVNPVNPVNPAPPVRPERLAGRTNRRRAGYWPVMVFLVALGLLALLGIVFPENFAATYHATTAYVTRLQDKLSGSSGLTGAGSADETGALEPAAEQQPVVQSGDDNVLALAEPDEEGGDDTAAGPELHMAQGPDTPGGEAVVVSDLQIDPPAAENGMQDFVPKAGFIEPGVPVPEFRRYASNRIAASTPAASASASVAGIASAGSQVLPEKQAEPAVPAEEAPADRTAAIVPAETISSVSRLPAEPRPVAAAPLPGEPLVIRFQHDSNEFQQSDTLKMREFAELMKQHPEAMVTVAGHTDSSGSEAYNRKLSEFRANIVQSFLLGQGVPAGQMRVRGLGSSKPLDKNDTADGRMLNRRVEISVER